MYFWNKKNIFDDGEESEVYRLETRIFRPTALPMECRRIMDLFHEPTQFFIGIEDPLIGTKGTKKGNENKLHETTELLFENG